MSTEKLVKWRKESQEFFNKAQDNSLVLDLVISYGCASQTGEGFEELINSINREEIKKKVKKVNITDTTYLYRHVIPKFSEYFDYSIPTSWFLDNRTYIEKLSVDTEIKPWAEDIDSNEFVRWHKQIIKDFIGDENGNGVIQEFRDLVLFEANKAASKGSGTLKQCIDFILEECAYTCAFFKNIIMIYSMKLGALLSFVNEHYGLNIRLCRYSTHYLQASRLHGSYHKKRLIDQEVVSFMIEKSANVNFFVIDKEGNFIYKNEECNKVIRHNDAKRLPPKTWEITSNVLKSGKQIIAEEESTEGLHYLSVKSPLIINGEVEGVIGLAVNITERKKVEELKKEVAIQRELYEIGKEVTHEIWAPLPTLGILHYGCKDKLCEQEREMLEWAIQKLREVSDMLLKRYMQTEIDKDDKGYLEFKKYLSVYDYLYEGIDKK